MYQKKTENGLYQQNTESGVYIYIPINDYKNGLYQQMTWTCTNKTLWASYTMYMTFVINNKRIVN
jgi:hypothetical protein